MKGGMGQDSQTGYWLKYLDGNMDGMNFWIRVK